MTKRSRGEVAHTLTSDTALAFSLSMLHRYEVDWEANGFDEDDLSELAEYLLRVLHSFLVDPGQAPREGDALRRFWLGGSVRRSSTLASPMRWAR